MQRPERIKLDLEFLSDDEARIRYEEEVAEEHEHLIDHTVKAVKNIMEESESDLDVYRAENRIVMEGVAGFGEIFPFLLTEFGTVGIRDERDALLNISQIAKVTLSEAGPSQPEPDIEEILESMTEKELEMSVGEILDNPEKLLDIEGPTDEVYAKMCMEVLANLVDAGVLNRDDTLEEASRKIEAYKKGPELEASGSA